MNNENKQYIDQLSREYLKGFGTEIAREAAQPVKIEPGKTPNQEIDARHRLHSPNDIADINYRTMAGPPAGTDAVPEPGKSGLWQRFRFFLNRVLRRG